MIFNSFLPAHQHFGPVTNNLRLLLTVHGSCVPANVLRQIRLSFIQGNFPVLVKISLALHATHQVVAEDAVLQIWTGTRYLICLTG